MTMADTGGAQVKHYLQVKKLASKVSKILKYEPSVIISVLEKVLFSVSLIMERVVERAVG